ncbi:DUF3140 domain-containing protein [Anditalea andensis]|uniref:DNA-binding protein n=1 Tax=Anditalea andensis TaxID=1048983 RepID=A0A074KZX6_9BACT|nr:DUF3140 domain-containing protein [Anditalea andensis]KEO73143.1 DNA-binding protein [Anditalea andensis]
MASKENDDIYNEFYEKVNMTPSELEKWLETEESKSSGQGSENGQSIGYKSGKKIIKIKRTKKENLKEVDYKHMSKVNSYIARHSAQKPEGDISKTTWRYSLKNWGFDPLKNK